MLYVGFDRWCRSTVVSNARYSVALIRCRYRSHISERRRRGNESDPDTRVMMAKLSIRVAREVEVV